MKLPIYLYGHPLLRRLSEDIDSGYEGLQELIDNMYETMYDADGIGLAAPQIGKNIRVVVIDLNPLSSYYPEYKDFKMAYVNPHILEYDDDSAEETLEEGCLSIPGINEKVTRPARIHVKYMDRDFKEHDEWVEGYLARVMQHEFDHLDGKLFVDHISPFRKQLIAKKLKAIKDGKSRTKYRTKVAKK